MLLRRRSQKVDVLRQVPLFRSLSNRDLNVVARYADEITSAPGKTLVRKGENARELLIMVDGSARVERDGHVVAHLGPGEFIGEMALIDGQPRSATVITDSPSTLLIIEGRAFWPLVESVPGFARKLMVGLSLRMRELQDHHAD